MMMQTAIMEPAMAQMQHIRIRKIETSEPRIRKIIIEKLQIGENKKDA